MVLWIKAAFLAANLFVYLMLVLTIWSYLKIDRDKNRGQDRQQGCQGCNNDSSSVPVERLLAYIAVLFASMWSIRFTAILFLL